ncbi:MAG: acyl dehydratase, partial [Pseudomonadota bacterium]
MDRTLEDIMDPARATAMQAALGMARKEFANGDALPHFWHHAYFWDITPEDRLGADGLPKPSGILPKTGLPRRMWVSGEVEFLRPMTLGKPARKVSRLKMVDEQEGATGKLAAVVLHHDISQDEAPCIKEDHTLIFRDAYDPEEPKPMYDHTIEQPEIAEEIVFSAVQLFRYGSVTFNAHRIHYDAPYAENGEGYEDVVVPTPLLAQHLIQFCERQGGGLKRFQYRSSSPLSVMEPAT